MSGRIFEVMEEVYPYFIALICSILVYIYGDNVRIHFELKSWRLSNIYNTMFGLSSILTGFLTAFYGIIVTSSGGFIARVQKSRHFRRYKRFVKTAIWHSFFFAIITIPFTLVEPLPNSAHPRQHILICAWIFFAVESLVAFFRVADSFFRLVDSDVEPRHLAH